MSNTTEETRMSKSETIMIDDVQYVRKDSIPVSTPLPFKGSYFECGKIYLIRTVTMIDTGRVVAVNDHEIVLEDAAWIADTGRFSDALKKASFNEVEPFPDGRVILGRGAVIDAVCIGSIQRSQK